MIRKGKVLLMAFQMVEAIRMTPQITTIHHLCQNWDCQNKRQSTHRWWKINWNSTRIRSLWGSKSRITNERVLRLEERSTTAGLPRRLTVSTSAPTRTARRFTAVKVLSTCTSRSSIMAVTRPTEKNWQRQSFLPTWRVNCVKSLIRSTLTYLQEPYQKPQKGLV